MLIFPRYKKIFAKQHQKSSPGETFFVETEHIEISMSIRDARGVAKQRSPPRHAAFSFCQKLLTLTASTVKTT